MTEQIDYHIWKIDKKVTIILLISFQLSYNKVDKDLYNPIWITCLNVFLFSSPKRSNKRQRVQSEWAILREKQSKFRP